MKVVDNDQWVEDNFGNGELGDARRTKRLMSIAGNMLATPEKSLPQQNVEWADLKAAYRFFANENNTFDKIAQPHWQQTRQTKPGRYLLISDTTDVDHSFHKATTGLGMLGDGRGRGMQLHHCLMYDCNQGQIRGSAGASIYYRKRKPKNETRSQRFHRRWTKGITGRCDLGGSGVGKLRTPFT